MLRSIVFFVFAVISALSGPLFAACPFCTPSVIENQSVYENEQFVVLVDIAPVMSGHLLVVPKRHMMKAHEMTEKEWTALSDVIPKVVKVFQSVYNTDQYLIIEKNGPFAGQTVPHVHFHCLPMVSQKIAAEAKATLFAKLFNQMPSRLSKEDVHAEAVRLRTHFEAMK